VSLVCHGIYPVFPFSEMITHTAPFLSCCLLVVVTGNKSTPSHETRLFLCSLIRVSTKQRDDVSLQSKKRDEEIVS